MTIPAQKYYYLAGVGVTHSIAPPLHQCVADALGLPWTFKYLEASTIEDLMAVFRRDDFAGGVVTMPYKKTIMPYLDELDDKCVTLGSCNHVAIKDGKLIGSNTDYIGILEPLRKTLENGIGRPAMVIGAGGASRAAVYALYAHLECKTIYLVNRDEQEVADLQADSRAYGSNGPTLIHLKSVAEAQAIPSDQLPGYVVGTVPNFEPKTESEIECSNIVRYVLKNTPVELRSTFLEMCYNPRNTRFLKLAKSLEWKTVEGINCPGWQIPEQYRMWVGRELADKIPMNKAWEALYKSADASKKINS